MGKLVTSQMMSKRQLHGKHENLKWNKGKICLRWFEFLNRLAIILPAAEWQKYCIVFVGETSVGAYILFCFIWPSLRHFCTMMSTHSVNLCQDGQEVESLSVISF
jgi:hypothetical protein